MKRLFALFFAILTILCSISCGAAKKDTVVGSYYASNGSFLSISDDGTYKLTLDGKSSSGNWNISDGATVTVLDGDSSFDGISVVLTPNGENVKLDSVIYTLPSGQVRLQVLNSSGEVFNKKQ